MQEIVEPIIPISFLNDTKLKSAQDTGQIVIGLAIKEIPPYERITVAEYFKGKEYDKAYNHYIVAGTLLQTGEQLLLPPDYRYCSVIEKHEKIERPPAGYLNSDGILQIINLDNVATR